MNKACYLCSGCDFDVFSGMVRDKPEISIQKCKQCGLVFLSNFDHIVQDTYRGSGMLGGCTDIATWLRETALDDQRRFDYFKGLIIGKKVLDFGCGNGGFLIRARQIARLVTGLDLDDNLSSHFKEQQIPFVNSLEGLRGTYDIITLFHVLEHLRDPRITLQELIRHLSPEGKMIIEVPNADDVLLRLYECEAFSKFTYWSFHLFSYTAATLEKLFQQIGATTQYIKYIQRYSLSNHLYWLAKQKPNGHHEWKFLDSPALAQAYEERLVALGMTDTLLASIHFSRE
jgi:2-polyprenyl-3-methyl-5-hydroxy-6-metoxy-1,4-benzoquinol methylase